MERQPQTDHQDWNPSKGVHAVSYRSQLKGVSDQIGFRKITMAAVEGMNEKGEDRRKIMLTEGMVSVAV